MPKKTVQLPRHPMSAALLERFGFQTPETFRTLEARHFFQWAEKYRRADLTKPGDHYLWFNDMEWFQPDRLRTFKFESYHKDGFVPFAFSGGGDFWCWYPAMEAHGVVPVLLCPRDSRDADLYAPDFASALFRHALDYSTQILLDEDEQNRQRMLSRWEIDLGSLWPAKWRKRIKELAGNQLEGAVNTKIVADEFGKKYATYGQVRWMED